MEFYQYQQDRMTTTSLKSLTTKKASGPGFEQAQKCDGVKPGNGSQPSPS